jgi:hypothetical protein
MRGISWLAQNWLPSPEGLCCMEWVSITFRDMPLVLVDYTIQAVWSFCNNHLTVIMDSTTRTPSGAEEMLLHVAIRSADQIIRLHLPVGTFNTCTAPTGMLEMTTGCFKIITFRIMFTHYVLNYANIDCLIWCCLQISPSQACHVLTVLGKIFIISVS